MTDFEITPDNLNDKTKNNEEIYKIWSRTKEVSRFLSVKYFAQGKKFIIDIGVTDNGSGKLKSSTFVFVDAVILLSYIRAINRGTAPNIYRASDNPKDQLPCPESIIVFGGGIVEGKPIARVFKTHYWQSGGSYDPTAFAWKCAHFTAKQSSSGAFIQADSTPISNDSIKMTRKQIAEMEILLEAALMKDLVS